MFIINKYLNLQIFTIIVQLLLIIFGYLGMYIKNFVIVFFILFFTTNIVFSKVPVEIILPDGTKQTVEFDKQPTQNEIDDLREYIIALKSLTKRELVDKYFNEYKGDSPNFELPQEHDIFDFFYVYNSDDNLCYFYPLSKKQIKSLSNDDKVRYNNIVKADKLWNKAQKYKEFSQNWIYYNYQAYKLNPYLYPVLVNLADYYFDKKNYKNAIYYYQRISPNYRYYNAVVWNLTLSYYLNKDYAKSIEYSKYYMALKDADNKFFLTANDIIMNSYFYLNDFDNTLKYANILIYDYHYCHDYQYDAWEKRYYSFYRKKEYDKALNTAIQMSKIWGYKDCFDKIKSATSDKKNRISSYNIVKQDQKRRGNTQIVNYIDTLISQEKGIKPVNQQQKSSSDSNNQCYDNSNSQRQMMQDYQTQMMLYNQEEMLYQMQRQNQIQEEMAEQQRRMYQQQYMMQQQQMLQNQMRYTEMMNLLY